MNGPVRTDESHLWSDQLTSKAAQCTSEPSPGNRRMLRLYSALNAIKIEPGIGMSESSISSLKDSLETGEQSMRESLWISMERSFVDGLLKMAYEINRSNE